MAAFSKVEYDRRLDLVRQRMEQSGFDVLLTSNPANMNYLTGYDGWSFYTPQLVAVSLAHREPLCIVRGIDQPGGMVTTHLSANEMVGYPDHYVQADDKHPMDWIGDFLESRGMGKGCIAVDMDAYYYSARAHASLVTALPNAKFVDSKNIVNWVRVIKSDDEIKYMHDAARLVELAMQAGIDAIEPGHRQCDAVADIHSAQIRGTKEFGGEYTSLVPMLPSGVGTTTPHLTWSSEPFNQGEATILELAGCRMRYHCPMSRTVHLGPPPARMAEIADVSVDALNIAIDAAKPGVRCEEVHQVWNTYVKKYGIEKDSRMGYSTGLNYPPDWGEHTLSIRPGDKTVLEPGMTLHVIPGIWLDNWGIEISEAIHITDQGAVKFCDFPQHLVIKN